MGAGPWDALVGKGPSEAAPEAVGQAVGGGCRSGWGRLLSFTNAIDRPLLSDPGGGGVVPSPGRPTHPPTSEIFSSGEK